jgi:hypothetical protein
MTNNEIIDLFGKWGVHYNEAKQFYIENNHLLIEKNYKTNDGYSLGNWIQKQRNKYFDISKNKLTPLQIQLLNDIEMVWSLNDYRWNLNYNEAKKYYIEHNHLRIPYIYEVNGLKLGKWIHTQRKAFKNQSDCKISNEHIQMLDDIGMIWEVFDNNWNNYYSDLVDYYYEYGHIDIPSSYITKEKKKLGLWLWTQKKDYKNGFLSKDKIALLEKLNIIWVSNSIAWNENYQVAKKYYLKYGDLNVKQNYVINGYSLGNWISYQRKLCKENSKNLTTKQIQMLNDIGMIW